MGDHAGLVANRAGAVDHLADAAVARDEAVLHIDDVDGAVIHPLDTRHHCRAIVLMYEVGEGEEPGSGILDAVAEADDIGGGVDLLERLVRQGEVEHSAALGHDDVGVVQFILEALAIGDVGGDAGHAEQPSGAVENRALHCPVGALLTGGLDDVVFLALDECSVGHHLTVVGAELLRQGEVKEGAVVLAPDLLERGAEHGLNRLVGVDIAALEVFRIDGRVHVVEQRPKAGVLLA